jgi:cellulose synthase/poly-beta-1,6-N-acetylglucosamine synthase-like glycosyltransferase
MKSKQLDKIAETSCKDCKFAIYQGKTQTGCEAGRVETYMENGLAFEAYDKDKEFYVVNTLCSYKIEKKYDLSVEQIKEIRKKSFGIAIYIDNEETEGLEETIASICSIDYDPSKICVCISHSYKLLTAEFTSKMKKQMRALEDAGFHSINVVVYGSERQRDYDTFKKIARQNYITRLKVGQTVDKNTYKKIDDYINEKLERFLFFEDSDCCTVLFKAVNSRYLEHNDYGKMEEALLEESKAENFYKCVNG